MFKTAFSKANPDLAYAINKEAKENDNNVSLSFLVSQDAPIADLGLYDFIDKNNFKLGHDIIEVSEQAGKEIDETPLVLYYKITKDQEALEEIERLYRPIINRIVYKYLGGSKSQQYEDYLQEAFIGVMKALSKINPDTIKKNREAGLNYFRFYAVRCINSSLVNYKRDNDHGGIRHPKTVTETLNKMWSWIQKNGYYIGAYEDKKVSEEMLKGLEEYMGMSREHIFELFELSNQMSSSNCPLDDVIKAEDADYINKEMSYDSGVMVEDEIVRKKVIGQAMDIIDDCVNDKNEAIIVGGMTGLNEDGEIMSIKKLSVCTGLSTYMVKLVWNNLSGKIAKALVEAGITPDILRSLRDNNGVESASKKEKNSFRGDKFKFYCTLASIIKDIGQDDVEEVSYQLCTRLEEMFGEEMEDHLKNIGIKTSKDVHAAVETYINDVNRAA